jgi:hypothetical protein
VNWGEKGASEPIPAWRGLPHPSGELKMVNGEWKIIGRECAISKTRHYPFSIIHFPFAPRACPPRAKIKPHRERLLNEQGSSTIA